MRSLLLHGEVATKTALYDCCKLLTHVDAVTYSSPSESYQMPPDLLLACMVDSALSLAVRVMVCSILLSKSAALQALEGRKVQSVLLVMIHEMTGCDATMARDIEVRLSRCSVNLFRQISFGFQ